MSLGYNEEDGREGDGVNTSLAAPVMLGEGMQLWYNTDLQPITAMEADELLKDDLARRIAHTAITTEKGRIEVSTIFLALDHGWNGSVPVLWETMVFGGPDDMEQRRYSSRTAAEAGHAETVTCVKAALDLEGVAVIAEETFEGAAHG